MDDQQVGWLMAIIIGGLAGWLAEKMMKTDHSLLLNIILGIVGAIIGNFLLSAVGVAMGGALGYLIAGFVGACLLIAIGRLLRKSPRTT
jgi:uncharacterized membrane protein YeaQ/YmgE (transglycosylase-associated protein family)